MKRDERTNTDIIAVFRYCIGCKNNGRQIFVHSLNMVNICEEPKGVTLYVPEIQYEGNAKCCLSNIIQRILAGKEIICPDLHYSPALLWWEDLANALTTMMQRDDCTQGHFYLQTARSATYEQIINEVAALTCRKVWVQVDGQQLANKEYRCGQVDNNFNFTTISVMEMIMKLVPPELTVYVGVNKGGIVSEADKKAWLRAKFMQDASGKNEIVSKSPDIQQVPQFYTFEEEALQARYRHILLSAVEKIHMTWVDARVGSVFAGKSLVS
ncbi:MAG: hypothetical protein IJ709_10860 [Selenomonas sp.]|nr:hypothetical protein [Selenomonas sp.]